MTDTECSSPAEFSREDDLSAGEFSSWLRETVESLRGHQDADVPCGSCNACCRSSYFIHVEPNDHAAIASIPDELMFPAPGLPSGHKIMGYNENGCCPMLVQGKCSIYDQRPRTCRQYDCRVFPAAGLSVREEEKIDVAQQARRWKFEFPASRDRAEFAAVQAAAKFLDQHASEFPDGFVPSNSTQQAVLAIRSYEVFLDLGNEDAPRNAESTVEAVVTLCTAKGSRTSPPESPTG